jgi:hypothetical protein
MTSLRRALLVTAVVSAVVPELPAQVMPPGATHRVFLTDGRALPSYGEAIQVDDRLIFTLLVSGTAGRNEMQLMSLPASAVDLERTRNYAEAMRAAHYAATRGEADYAAVTEEVRRAIDQLKGIEDSKRRLGLAEEAKRRLLTWSEEHYSYRANNIRELTGLFDEVIAELRAAAGESQFSLDLRAGPAGRVYEPLAAPPSLRDSVALALGAASLADVGEDRVAVLRATAALLERETGVDDLRESVKAQLAAELSADREYVLLSEELLTKADAAMRKGDVSQVMSVRATVTDRDRALGFRRPVQIQSLVGALEVKLEATRAYRLALEHHAYIRKRLLAYELRVRPALSALDGLKSVIEFIRDMKSMSFERLESAHRRLEAIATDLETVVPPPDLSDVHATLVSAVHMARQACDRRRLAVITTSMDMAREASTAAAGAQLLATQSRDLLIKRLYPPKFGGS